MTGDPPEEEQQEMGSDLQGITKQRQDALDKGNLEDANQAGYQLKKMKAATG